MFYFRPPRSRQSNNHIIETLQEYKSPVEREGCHQVTDLTCDKGSLFTFWGVVEACDDERGCLHVRQEIMQCSRAARCKPQGDHSTSLENQDHGLCGRDGRMWESWMQKVYVSFDKVVLVAWLDTQPTTKSVRRNSDTVLIRKPHSFLQARALSYWTR